MNKPVYSGMSISEISKTLMYKFWHDYITPKYQHNAKLRLKILAALLFRLKLKIFTKVLHMMLLNGLTHQTIVKMIKDQFQEV